MSAFTSEQLSELANLTRRETSKLDTLIRQLQGTTDYLTLADSGAARKVDFGSSSVVFTASQTSAATTVNHDLGVTPVSVIAATTGAAHIHVSVAGGPTSVSFSVSGYSIPGVTTGTAFFYWIAIG